MPPRPSQKRAAEPRAADAQKKTRFVEPSEDPARFEETVEATLEDRTARSRRKVKTEGYDSDSSDEGGESVVRSRAANASGSGVAQEDEDEDMFAVGEKDTKVDTTSGDGTKKKDEYLRLGDIEGQEFNEAQGENDSDESDEPEDEDDAERKAKAGMGFELSSFNMREEMEEGKFTEDGSYVRAFDAHAQHDRWMDGVDEREMKRARKRKREREKVESDRIKAEEQALADAGGKPSLERDLLAMLKRGESVLEALQRLGAQAKKAQKLDKRKDKANAKGDLKTPAASSSDGDKTAKPFNPIEHVTHLASMLMSLGDTDVYSTTYEELVRSVRRSGLVPENWEPPSADVKYEYMWAVPDTTAPGQVLGPYSEEEMKSWNTAGFFGDRADKIRVRTVGGEWGSWKDVVL